MPARKLAAAISALLVGAACAGCTLVKNEDGGGPSQDGIDVFFKDASFDPDKMAAELWEAQILPYLDSKAGDFAEVSALLRSDLDEAGGRFGYREQTEGAPWAIVTRIKGTIVAADTGTRAATIDVDVDDDGAADATIQIGPVIRGTALRDSLDFVPFGSFTNQIDFARFGKALNTLANETELSSLPRDNLAGRTVSALGVFVIDDPTARPVITAARIGLDGESQ